MCALFEAPLCLALYCMIWQVFWFYLLAASLCLTNSHIFPVPCETLQSTTDIIVNLTSTAMGSNATYQCRDGSSDVYTTQCTSDRVWEPNPNSILDCTPPGIMLPSWPASYIFVYTISLSFQSCVKLFNPLKIS